MVKLFNYDEVKDIQESYIKATENKDDMIKILANRYSVDESMIIKVLEGDKNVTSYAQIKSVKSKGVTIKNKEILNIAQKAIDEFKQEENKEEQIEIDNNNNEELKELVDKVFPPKTTEENNEEEKPKKKGGWQKGRPRGKKVDKEKKEEDNSVSILVNFSEVKNINEEEYKIIIESLKLRMQSINNQIINLEKEMKTINDIVKKLEKENT